MQTIWSGVVSDLGCRWSFLTRNKHKQIKQQQNTGKHITDDSQLLIKTSLTPTQVRVENPRKSNLDISLIS